MVIIHSGDDDDDDDLIIMMTVVSLSLFCQWDLVCDKNYLVETSQSVFNFGVMVGAFVFTMLADRIGRKPVHILCQYAMLVLGLAIAYSGNYVTFVVLRFFQGAMREAGDSCLLTHSSDWT